MKLPFGRSPFGGGGGSTNAQRTGIWNVVITLFNFQRYARQIGFRVQRNIRHPTHNNATNTDRRARFQAANVIERRIKRVGRFSTYGRHVRRLQANKQRRQQCC